MLKFDSAIYSKNNLTKITSLENESLSLDNAKYILMYDQHIVFKNAKPSEYAFSYQELCTLKLTDQKGVYLGNCQNKTNYFAIDLKETPPDEFTLIHLKTLPTENRLPEQILGMFAQALTIINWNLSHQFCGCCGNQTTESCYGWRRDCEHCHQQHFPRIDPVVIMLVTHGNETLIGAGNDFTEKRYSCLAGFIEPGETIESAAKRELYEESGLIAEKISYLISQPWPFPFSLMIGLHVTTQQKEVVIQTSELKDLKWVSKQDIQNALQNKPHADFSLPSTEAIAHTLLLNWAST